MALSRYSRFIFNTCKNSRIAVPRNPIEEPISETAFSCKSSTISALQNRFYFKNREYEGRWFHNPKRVGAAIFLFDCGVASAVFSGDWVTVPYSGRRRFIFFHKLVAKIISADIDTESDTIPFGGESLPLVHPYYVTARGIFQDIMDEALPLEMVIKRELEVQNNTMKVEKSSEDDKCEITVLDSNRLFAASNGRFGKMYVTTALIDYYREHEIIASIFGREVGQYLARHPEERLSKIICLASVTAMNVYLFWQSTYIRSKMPSLIVKLMRLPLLPSLAFVASVPLLSYVPMMKFYREMEYEGDYVGLMMAASSGYNPLVGVMYPAYKARVVPPLRWPECFYSFPTLEKRGRHLSHPDVLLEAVTRYNRWARLSTEAEST